MTVVRRTLAEVDIGIPLPLAIMFEVEGERAWIAARNDNSMTSFTKFFYDGKALRRMETDPRVGWARFFDMTPESLALELLRSLSLSFTDGTISAVAAALESEALLMAAAIVMDS